MIKGMRFLRGIGENFFQIVDSDPTDPGADFTTPGTEFLSFEVTSECILFWDVAGYTTKEAIQE